MNGLNLIFSIVISMYILMDIHLPVSHHVWSPSRLNSWTVVILNIHK